MERVRSTLMRKLGPLPVWAWTIVAFIVVYYVRKRTASTTVDQGASGQVVDSTATPGDPVTAGPGEGIYDPSTGQLHTVTPDQLPPDIQPSITLEPGEAAYNPNTGQTVTNNPPTHTTKKKKKKKKKNKPPRAGRGHQQGRTHGPRIGGKSGGPAGGKPHPHRARTHKHKAAGKPGYAAPQPAGGRSKPRAFGNIFRPRHATPPPHGTPEPQHHGPFINPHPPKPRSTSGKPTLNGGPVTGPVVRYRGTVNPPTPEPVARPRATPPPHTVVVAHPATHPSAPAAHPANKAKGRKR